MIWASVIDLLGGWLKGRQQVQAAKVQARADRVANGIPGWSDEWLVLIFSYPVIAGFIPGLRANVAEGFAAIENMPEWYIKTYMAIVAAVFGLDKVIMTVQKARRGQ